MPRQTYLLRVVPRSRELAALAAILTLKDAVVAAREVKRRETDVRARGTVALGDADAVAHSFGRAEGPARAAEPLVEDGASAVHARGVVARVVRVRRRVDLLDRVDDGRDGGDAIGAGVEALAHGGD